MFKFIKGLFVNEPEAPAPENLVLFTPNDGSWDPKMVRRLFDAGLGRLHVQVRKDWERRHYEQFLRSIPEAFWPRIVLGEEPELVEALGRLAERQRSIERAAQDIVSGRTPEVALRPCSRSVI
jgi:hypothetical protein